MPFFLTHGPASPQKSRAFWDLLEKNHFQGERRQNFLILTSDSGFVHRHKRDLLQNTSAPLVVGESVLTFEDFLLKLTKKNRHRVHEADEKMSLYLLFLLIFKKHRHLLAGGKTVTEMVGEIYAFFLHVKKCGIGTERAQAMLSPHLEEPRLLELFADYQAELRALHYYDPADLTLAVLEDLRSGTCQWLEGIEHVYLSKIYPIHAGHREILRLLKKARPEVTFHVFYDEDYNRDEDLLSQAYEDLGAMSDGETHFPATEPIERVVLDCPTPNQEIRFVLGQIQALLAAGVAPHAITIVCGRTYETLLKLLLRRHGIPHTVNLSLSVSEFLPSQTGLTEIVENPRFPENFIRLSRRDNVFAGHKLQAMAALERHREKIAFLRTVLAELSQDVPAEDHENFLDFLLQNLSFNAGADQYETVLTDLNRSLALNDRHVFLVGLYFENISFRDSQTLYSPLLYARREFAELLNFPIYQYKIALEKLKQLLYTTPGIVLTRPIADFSDKPTSPIPYDDIIFIAEPYATPAVPAAAIVPHDYEAGTELCYSITQLQNYIDCPYRYYASHHLRLDGLEKDSVEPPADVRGSFAHRVLEKLLKDNSDLYVRALADEGITPALIAVLRELVTRERDGFEDFGRFDPVLISVYAERLGRAIETILGLEAQGFRKGKKSTLPKHVEWKIAHGDQAGYRIQTRHGTVTLTGRIDRIDIDEDRGFFTVIDYKTGEPPAMPEIRRGEQIQIPIYLLAVENGLYPGLTPAGGLYYQLKDAKIEGFGIKGAPDAKLLHHSRQISEEDWDGISARALINIEAAVTGILGGRFDPQPREIKICRTCDYKRICGHRKRDAEL